MRFKYIRLLLLLAFYNIAQAQQIKVIHTVTKAPLPEVSIQNLKKTKSVTTNFKGVAKLDVFKDSDTLYFTYLSQVLKSLTALEAKKLKVIGLEANTQGLGEIIISASKFGQFKDDIPQKILKGDANAIEFANPQTSADALQNTGPVFVQKSQLGGGSPIIRGFSTNRLLITVDGVRMNNAIFRGGNLHNVIVIDPLSVASTEVILGAGSVIYGSDAVGGVMSFYTKAPKLSYKDSLLLQANAIVRYASASNEKTGHFDISLGLKKLGFLTSVTHTDFDDLRTGINGPDDYLRTSFAVRENGIDVEVDNSDPRIQRFTGYNQLNITQKVTYEPTERLNLDLGVHYSSSSNIPRYDRLLRRRGDGSLRSAEWDYGPQVWFMTNLQATQSTSNSVFYDKAKTTLAYQRFEESRIDRDFQSTDRRIREEGVDAYSLNLDFEKVLSYKTKLFYGGAYVFNNVSSRGTIENIETNNISNTLSRYPDGASWSSTALYTSLKYKPSSTFVLQSGLRYSYVTSKSDFRENNQFLNLPFDEANNTSSALTGSVGLSWSPNAFIQWKLNLGTAFRAPNIDDIGKVFDSEPGSVVVPNNNLKPEYAYNGELSLKLNFKKKLILDLSAYYTLLDDALVRRDDDLNGETEIIFDGTLSNVQSIQNASEAKVYGFEAGLKLKLHETLNLTSQYSIIRGYEESNNERFPVRHVAPDFGNTHLIWKQKKWTADAFLIYNATLNFNELALSERGKNFIYAEDANGNPFSPSWYTLNLRAQYQISKTITLTTALENITNQLYRPYSSGISAPGRNLIVSLKYGL